MRRDESDRSSNHVDTVVGMLTRRFGLSAVALVVSFLPAGLPACAGDPNDYEEHSDSTEGALGQGIDPTSNDGLTDEQLAEKYGVVFTRPAYLDPAPSAGYRDPANAEYRAYQDLLPWFVKDVPDTTRRNPAERQNKLDRSAVPLTEAQGRDLYFRGIIPRLKTGATFSVAARHSATRAGALGLLADSRAHDYWPSAPCAVSASHFLEYVLGERGLVEPAERFSDHNGRHSVTHWNEIEVKNLGWNYFAKSKYVAPRGAMGMWSRYYHKPTKYAEHSGHTYWILRDDGSTNGKNDLTAYNGSIYGVAYRPSGGGSCEGFWLPPGVYPRPR